MKKLLIVFVIFISSFSLCLGNNSIENKSITIKDYLYLNKESINHKILKLDDKGNVIYKDKYILTEKGLPLNYDSAYTDDEFKVLFYAAEIKPKKNCNPKDKIRNGALGCYIDNPDE